MRYEVPESETLLVREPAAEEEFRAVPVEDVPRIVRAEVERALQWVAPEMPETRAKYLSERFGTEEACGEPSGRAERNAVGVLFVGGPCEKPRASGAALPRCAAQVVRDARGGGRVRGADAVVVRLRHPRLAGRSRPRLPASEG